MAEEHLEIELKDGTVKIKFLPDVAPKHVERIKTLANSGAYDGIAFHRVIEGFMAQTGDVEHGKLGEDGQVSARAGTGGSEHGYLDAEFSRLPFERGVCGMARAQNPNSANSQFFIMFDAAPSLNNQYTVWGQVTEGMEVVDKIKRGSGGNGMVSEPDKMISVKVVES